MPLYVTSISFPKNLRELLEIILHIDIRKQELIEVIYRINSTIMIDPRSI